MSKTVDRLAQKRAMIEANCECVKGKKFVFNLFRKENILQTFWIEV